MAEPATTPQWRMAMRLSIFVGVYWFVVSSALYVFDHVAGRDGALQVLPIRWILFAATASLFGMIVSPMLWLLVHPRHRFALVATIVLVTVIVISGARMELTSSAVGIGYAAQLFLPLIMRLLSDWWTVRHSGRSCHVIGARRR